MFEQLGMISTNGSKGNWIEKVNSNDSVLYLQTPQ